MCNVYKKRDQVVGIELAPKWYTGAQFTPVHYIILIALGEKAATTSKNCMGNTRVAFEILQIV